MGKMTILDGAMGTMLQAAGLGLGERPEIFGMQHPEIVEQIHSCYIDAGSDVIYANTFGANAHKLMTPQARKAAIAAGRAVDVSADDFDDED